jgi:hypothetical protein
MLEAMKKRGEILPVDVPMPPPDPALADQMALGSKQLVCSVCGSRGAVRKDDLLCWVCRRLKISAWRDVEKLGSPE